MSELFLLAVVVAAAGWVLSPLVGLLTTREAIRSWVVGIAADACDAVRYFLRRRRLSEHAAQAQLDAESRIDVAHRRARHAMNTAADQSWRNLAG